MVKYEILYITDPTLTEEKQAALQDRIRKQIEVGCGEIESTDDWGLRRLAYPINKMEEGRYTLINFQSETQSIKPLDKQFRLIQGLMRFVIVRKEK